MISKVKDFVVEYFNKLKNFDVKKLKEFKFTKKNIIIISVVLIVCILAGFFTAKAIKSSGVNNEIKTARAQMGNISVVISGTGTVEANDQYEITSLVKGEIISDYFEEGDVVEKDALLYSIDTDDIENSISKSQLSLENAQTNYESALEDVYNLNVKSKISGTITNVYVKKGENIGANTKIADVIDSETMLLTIPFVAEDALTMYQGQTVNVKLDNSFYETTGTVKKITTGEIINSYGVAVKYVEILVNNPGSIREGDTATVIAGDVASNDAGEFTYFAEEAIIAEVGGKIEELYITKGDKAFTGGVVARLSSDSVNSTLKQRTNSLKDAQLSLENQYDNLDNYNIKAPISGTVLQKNAKAGDNLDNSSGNGMSTMAVIADLSKLLFKMNVDELDVSKIQLGQEVEISVDAIQDKIYTGYVDYISLIGSSQNGVTSYPVTIVIDNPENIIPGMNVSANIVVESKENILTVPVSAVQRGNFVYVKGDVKTETNEQPIKTPDGKEMPKMKNMPGAPDGFTAVKVEIGINDDNNIEIISGLKEGDIVYVTPTANNAGTTGMMPMGMPGGMGGGMPSGGMPGGMGGGMPSGGMPGGMGGGPR